MIDLDKETVVIAAMPLVDTIQSPMAAPAVLKASLTRAGIKSVALDLNIEVLVKVKSHPEEKFIREFFEKQEAEDWVVQEISKILLYHFMVMSSFTTDLS